MSRRISERNENRRWVLILIAVGCLLCFWYLKNHQNTLQNITDNSSQNEENQQKDTQKSTKDYLPTARGQVIEHKNFTLSYLEAYEQAEWVTYQLTKKNLDAPRTKRFDNFRPDPKVRTGSATPDDYRGSGYDRGHLCPASDMSFDAESMDETFLMSNISPQVRAFNGGIWRELEENVKDWARKYKHILVVTGPVLNTKEKKIGRANKVVVPNAYYKVLLAQDHSKAVGFIIPNEMSEERIERFIVSIDEVEEATGLDFFSFLEDPEEKKLEASQVSAFWTMKEERYQTRVREWNKGMH